MALYLVIVAFACGFLLGALSLIEWLVSRIARLWLDGRLAWLELWVVRMWRRIVR